MSPQAHYNVRKAVHAALAAGELRFRTTDGRLITVHPGDVVGVKYNDGGLNAHEIRTKDGMVYLAKYTEFKKVKFFAEGYDPSRVWDPWMPKEPWKPRT